MNESLFVEPKLLDGLDWISHAIGLDQYLPDGRIGDNILNGRCQIGPALYE